MLAVRNIGIFALTNFILTLPSFAQSDLATRVAELKWESLLEAYPNSIRVVNSEKKIFQVSSSRLFYFDDGSGPKNSEERLRAPDLEDTFFDVYPLDCSLDWKPGPDFDPGRYRNQDFLKEIYGSTKSEIEANLVVVPWIKSQTLRVTTREGVDKQFRKVFDFFSMASLSPFHKYLWPSEGGYNFRPIAGTDQLSSHSFGAAIDLNLKYSNYWKWENPDSNGSLPFVNQIPCEVIAGFETFGFVSGAKWYHYDTMHFEYRPELLLFSQKLRREFGDSLEALKDLSQIRIH